MARSRVGGSRAKISGKLGNQVYQIVRNPDGGFQQAVYSLPEDKRLALTPALAKQRMIMSIVMRHMNLLREFMSAAFEGVPEGTLSVQEFARVNIKYLQEHFDDEGYPQSYIWWPLYGQNLALPAPLIITQGTFKPSAIYQVTRIYSKDYGYFRCYFRRLHEEWTVRDWLYWSNFTVDEYICEMIFAMGKESKSPSYQFVRFHINPELDLDTPVFDVDPNDFFVVDGTCKGSFRWWLRPDADYRELEFESEKYTALANNNGYCTIQFGMQNGKWRISNSQVQGVFRWALSDCVYNNFDTAFKTWYDNRLTD